MTVTAAAAVTAAVVAAAGTAAGVGAVSLPPHFLPPRPAHREAQERRERAAARGTRRRGTMLREGGALAGADFACGWEWKGCHVGGKAYIDAAWSGRTDGQLGVQSSRGRACNRGAIEA